MNSILLRKSVRDLRKSLAQSLALIVISLLGVASFIALVGAYRDLGSSYNRAYDQLHFADTTVSLVAAPATVVNQIEQVPGVQAATGRLIIDGGMSVPSNTQGGSATLIRARVIGIPESAPSSERRVRREWTVFSAVG